MSLDRASILAIDDTSGVLEINIPEWRGSVFIRTLTGTERDLIEREATINGKAMAPNFRARFACLVLADSSGKRLFTDKDAPLLGQRSATSLDVILKAGMKHNHIGDDEVSLVVGESEGVQN